MRHFIHKIIARHRTCADRNQTDPIYADNADCRTHQGCVDRNRRAQSEKQAVNNSHLPHRGAWITTKGGRYAPTIEILLRADHR